MGMWRVVASHQFSQSQSTLLIMIISASHQKRLTLILKLPNTSFNHDRVSKCSVLWSTSDLYVVSLDLNTSDLKFVFVCVRPALLPRSLWNDGTVQDDCSQYSCLKSSSSSNNSSSRRCQHSLVLKHGEGGCPNLEVRNFPWLETRSESPEHCSHPLCPCPPTNTHSTCLTLWKFLSFIFHGHF